MFLKPPIYTKSVSAHLPHVYTGSRQIFLDKGSYCEFFRLGGHVVSVVTIQCCYYGTRAVLDGRK